MATVTIEEAQAKLRELIDGLALGEEGIITRNHQPVAKLVGQQRPMRKPRQPGRGPSLPAERCAALRRRLKPARATGTRQGR